MPRKSTAVIQSKKIDTKMQAIVRSEQAHLERSNRNCRKSHRKPAKARGSYLPEPKILRIQMRYIAGENKSEIARNENCDRETVTRIVQFPEVREFISRMQQEFYGLVPDAMEALRYALQVKKDPRVGYRVLEGTGVAPHPSERLQLPPTTEEERMARQDRGIAAVIAQRRRDFNIELPAELEEAFKKGELIEEEGEGARATEAKLVRR